MTKNSSFGSTPVNNNIFFSIIIPVRAVNKILIHTLKKIKQQTFKSYEVIVITDEDVKQSIDYNLGPGNKRNIGAKKSHGKYLVFLDDDSYPEKDYLKNAYHLIKKKNLNALCGPQLTPKDNNPKQIVSGYILSSVIGSGAAGKYRNSPSKARYVKDYPSVNLIVKKSIFTKVRGFDIQYWPGEDTLFCRSLIKLNPKSIYYHPSLVVFHHRREIGLDFLKQHGRYGLHRGYFAKKFPENSAQIGYILPSILLFYLLILMFNPNPVLAIPLILYLVLLFFESLKILIKSRSVYISSVFFIFVPLTHLVYGLFFIKGLISNSVGFKPHKINPKTGQYIGG